MQAPKIPSFFKVPNSKPFSFKPRYYKKEKERIKQIEKGSEANIKFNINHRKQNEKGRTIRIVFMIIILSLLTYRFMIN